MNFNKIKHFIFVTFLLAGATSEVFAMDGNRDGEHMSPMSKMQPQIGAEEAESLEEQVTKCEKMIQEVERETEQVYARRLDELEKHAEQRRQIADKLQQEALEHDEILANLEQGRERVAPLAVMQTLIKNNPDEFAQLSIPMFQQLYNMAQQSAVNQEDLISKEQERLLNLGMGIRKMAERLVLEDRDAQRERELLLKNKEHSERKIALLKENYARFLQEKQNSDPLREEAARLREEKQRLLEEKQNKDRVIEENARLLEEISRFLEGKQELLSKRTDSGK